MGDIVYNIDGTSSRKCQCSYGAKTWLAHWERMTGLTLPDKCCARGCGDYVAVGAHVQHPDDLRDVWIVPFCQYHNKRPSNVPIELKWDVMLGNGARSNCV
jgi:hypothetical protein